MATLTETAYYARKGIRYGAIGFVALLVLWFATTSFIAWWKATHPDPLPPPTVDFGRLPPLAFPDSNFEVTEFQLQTPTGKIDEFTDRMTVFFAPVRKVGFLDPDRAIDLARRMDFLFAPEQPSEVLYIWTKSDPLPTTLKVDIVSGNFALQKQWQADPGLVVNKRFISDQQVILDAGSYLRRIGVMKADLAGQEKVAYLRAQGDRLIPAISLSEADFVQVDFFRSDYKLIDENKQLISSYGFWTPDPTRGLVSVVLSGSGEDNKKIINVDYSHVAVEYESTGEYPIKTGQEAWEELQAGEGYVASFTGSGVGVVRRISLGYFDFMENQKYEMPIYIFTGDDGLVVYVSAVSDEVLVVE